MDLLESKRLKALHGLKAAEAAVESFGCKDPGDLPGELFDTYGDILYDVYEAIFMLDNGGGDYDLVNEAISILPAQASDILRSFPNFNVARFKRGVRDATEYVNAFNDAYVLKM